MTVTPAEVEILYIYCLVALVFLFLLLFRGKYKTNLEKEA